ncbi:PREDICTED: F-box/FBD/LRR-repeat protein At5g44980-like [Camelina sativa]|uniref:F-box/FBD/LRR-repeat protein At5g44980-like n=1 Tax=Camelina sativa TaxID=90675 RepID=A0ABM0UT00_CAMSA|nr:PREDICTED: F-box/FBD/LRR-repeat protein At5g44980-like [Camelina sativa]
MECDYISELPDSLLTQILSYLRTKNYVKTSVLSKRWRNLWLNVPVLDLYTIEFRPYPNEEDFARFMERIFMEFNRGSHLQKFKITYSQCSGYRDRFMELIRTVVDGGIQDLDVSMHPCNRDDFIRQNIYKSKTLVSLNLCNVELKNPKVVVSLPCVKILKLSKVCYGEDGPLVVEKLISGCPVLEDLELIRPFDILSAQVGLFLRLRSQTLNSLCLSFAVHSGYTDFSVEIDAPRLKHMSVEWSQPDSIIVKNLSSLFKIDIRTKRYPVRPDDFNIFCDFLTGISSVRHMTISLWELQILFGYSKLVPVPIFENLYHLEAQVNSSSLQLLSAFLESCPNLKNLILTVRICSNLKYFVEKEPEQMDITNVPQCLIYSLEYVEIKNQRRDGIGIKLVNYFLENSAVLKKLIINFECSSVTNQELESYKKLLTSTKLSPIF